MKKENIVKIEFTENVMNLVVENFKTPNSFGYYLFTQKELKQSLTEEIEKVENDLFIIKGGVHFINNLSKGLEIIRKSNNDNVNQNLSNKLELTIEQADFCLQQDISNLSEQHFQTIFKELVYYIEFLRQCLARNNSK